ncbi:MAG: pyrimidine utilization protein D [Janthinobacterium lividum]
MTEAADAREAVLFCSGLGGAAAFWAPQLGAFASRFRVVTYDQRGTGSDRSRLPDGYTIADMADEAAVMLDRLGVGACHMVGHALGGAVGIEFARRHPGRIRRLAVINGWTRMDAHTARCFEARLALLDHCGTASYVRAQAIFLYPAAWASANADRLAAEDEAGVLHFQGAENLRTRVAALREWDGTDALRDLSCEVLALAAQDDVLVPWTASRTLAEGARHGCHVVLAEGGHACTVTCPDDSNHALLRFLTANGAAGIPPDGRR